MPYLGIFGPEFDKNYCHNWNKHSRICLIAHFGEETKMSQFGTKNALFGYFWARILKNYCHIWNQHPQICQKWAFNSYSEFWYRIRFFQRSGVHFSEDRVRVGVRFVKYALWSYLWSSDLSFSLICYQWFILKFLLYVPYDYIRCNDSEILLILLCP